MEKGRRWKSSAKSTGVVCPSAGLRRDEVQRRKNIIWLLSFGIAALDLIGQTGNQRLHKSPSGLREYHERETFKASTILMDDKSFTHCTFTDCKILYGGGPVNIDSNIFSGCAFELVGAAARTATFLQAFGLSLPSQFQTAPNKNAV